MGEGKCPTPAQSNHPIPSKGEGGEKNRNFVKSTVQMHRLTKRSLTKSYDYRTLPCPPHLATTLLKVYLQQSFLLSTLCLAIKKKLQGIPEGKNQKPKTKKRHLKRQSKHHSRDVGMIRPGMQNNYD